MESIKELRNICQETRDDLLYQRNWFDRNFTRRISMYITKPFLMMGLSANQVTAISLLVGMAAGVLLVFPDPVLWIVGILLFYLYFVLDCVDGEIARYRKTSSLVGSYLDGGLGMLMWPYVLACMTFGISNTVQDNTVFAFGFLATIGWLMYSASAMFPYRILHSKGRLPEIIEVSEKITEPLLMQLGRTVFGTRGFIPAVLVVTVVDWVVTPFTIGSFVANARFVYLVIFALATMAGIVLRVSSVMRHGVSLQKP
ncbi:MAG TPA: CDP-alcohol phosphatidyltransferase family protein [Acidobacteriota bacterium]|nr:CDP-alcohol phosphatidyltransferase family protein [Acidobacteriota bacterium]